MRKLRKAAVMAAAIGSVGFLGVGPAYADGHGGHGGGGHGGGKGGGYAMQGSNCRSHDFNLDILGEVGILNGVLANVLNGEGSPGAQATHMGSTMGCNNHA
ncbi:hypothetical protein [Streptomyces halobius]|uniref:Small secreted domain DUF320 n=1 Tax=Streptomyces halobius TaxID=2879846 RepID=A0ABY4MBB3_9ACTN|nr:hypothetical protein [Streptomyces halobius]UQA95037.1 hypothetical protein K9S39_27115 [Streptomyces halobius]